MTTGLGILSLLRRPTRLLLLLTLPALVLHLERFDRILALVALPRVLISLSIALSRTLIVLSVAHVGSLFVHALVLVRLALHVDLLHLGLRVGIRLLLANLRLSLSRLRLTLNLEPLEPVLTDSTPLIDQQPLPVEAELLEAQRKIALIDRDLFGRLA